MNDDDWTALDERWNRWEEAAQERWLEREEDKMETGDVGAAVAPEIESSMEPAAPALPTLPEPDETERQALEVALRSPAPVVAIPPAFNRPAADNQDVIEFAASCRRVIAPVGDQLVAVRPKPGCNTCNGSARWTLIVKGQRRACRCVVARIDAALGITRNPAQPQLAASASSSPRSDRLAELEARLAGMHRERDAVLVPIDGRIAEHEKVERHAVDGIAGIDADVAELTAEMEIHQRAVERYERLAEEERQAVATIAAARDERVAHRATRAKDVAAAIADRTTATVERQRVVARWADRTRGLERTIERLRGKVGVAASEPASEGA